MNAKFPDVLIIGGGPAGACAAIYLAKQGHTVRVLEKESFPRFHVGESLLPAINPLLRELGLDQALAGMKKMRKAGAEIAAAWQDHGSMFYFKQAYPWCERATMNVERAAFDKIAIDHAARQPGVEVVQNVAVNGIDRLRDGDCEVLSTDGPMRSRLVLDCSGQGAVLGGQLKTKRVFADHRKVAFVGHFKNVKRLAGDAAGFISLIMADEGWYWLIPIDEERTSIGLVMDKEAVRSMLQMGVAAGQEIAWAAPRTPCVAARLKVAEFPASNGCVSDFSYQCDPGADDGYLMVGDAEAFLDPIFSSGTYLAIAGARDAAIATGTILGGGDGHAARKRYLAAVASRRKVFFRYINMFYTHSFREFLIEGHGPVGVDRALIGFLSGRCQDIPLGMRLRLGLLNYFHARHRKKANIVAHRTGWSILENRATPRDEAIARLG